MGAFVNLGEVALPQHILELEHVVIYFLAQGSVALPMHAHHLRSNDDINNNRRTLSLLN